MLEYRVEECDQSAANRRVVISGCSGGGKSTLLLELARRGHSIRPEPGRQIVQEQQFIGGSGTPWDNAQIFIELCLSRCAYFYHSVEPSDGVTFFDRSVVDAAAAMMRLNKTLPPHFKTILEKYRYATDVFFAPPWEEIFEKDEERRHSFKDAVEEYEHLRAVYPEAGYQLHILPKGSVKARADFVEECLKSSADSQ